MARMLEAHVACEDIQWLGIRKWMEDRERKWDDCHKDDILWRTGISDMAAIIQAGVCGGEREPAAESCLEGSKHAGTTQQEQKQDPEQQQRQAEPWLEEQRPKLTPSHHPIFKNDNINEIYRNQWMGDCPAKEPEENHNSNHATLDYRPAPGPKLWLEYCRQMADLQQ
jgi:hypothetical protein